MKCIRMRTNSMTAKAIRVLVLASLLGAVAAPLAHSQDLRPDPQLYGWK
jgi:hypothetical protein